MPGKLLRQELPTSCQSARNRALGPSQLPGSLFARLAFQIAQDDDGPVFVRQSLQLKIERRPEFSSLCLQNRLSV